MFCNESGQAKSFEMFNGDRSKFDREAIIKLITHKDVELVTFNGNSYDIPILVLALSGASNAELKAASDEIVTRNVRAWHFYKQNGLVEPEINHIDLIEVAPGMVGLKMYGGRLHFPKLQELPIEPDATLTEEQAVAIKKYCKNDTLVTQSLYEKLREQIDLRRVMSEEYGTDLRSKSDAQIAEAVLKAEYQRLTGSAPPKTEINYTSFYYEPPSYVKFLTPYLQEKLQIIKSAEMVIEESGHVKMPKEIADMKIEIGGNKYKIGIGGLHSQESEVCHISDKDNLLIDRDVASYYPNLMLNMNMSPGSFGDHFQTVFRRILEERLVAKRSGDKVRADSLKITLNGTFGKTSNKYSLLYSPVMMIRTTLTGQLSLLMLIEVLDKIGIPVVSANTDGIVIKCPVGSKDKLDAVIARWESHTKLETEETVYDALYSRDVNNYIAITKDGKAKAKGVYGNPGLSKNPQNTICSEAVITYLSKFIPVEVTVRDCKDITKFLTLRTVNGGAEKNGEPIGKAIRWYYAVGEKGTINYVKNGNIVPRSEGAKPLMDIPETFPDDVDYEWYIRECEEILMSVGAKLRPVVEKLPRKNSKAWKELRDSGQIVENHKGKWEWAHTSLGLSAK
jgi:hypothetical protein